MRYWARSERHLRRIAQGKELIHAEKVDHGFSYSAAPPLENSRYRFENVALAATGEVGSLGNELLGPSTPIEAISLQG